MCYNNNYIVPDLVNKAWSHILFQYPDDAHRIILQTKSCTVGLMIIWLNKVAYWVSTKMDVFLQTTFWNECLQKLFEISFKIPYKFVPCGVINRPALVQMTVWRRHTNACSEGEKHFKLGLNNLDQIDSHGRVSASFKTSMISMTIKYLQTRRTEQVYFTACQTQYLCRNFESIVRYSCQWPSLILKLLVTPLWLSYWKDLRSRISNGIERIRQ